MLMACAAPSLSRLEDEVADHPEVNPGRVSLLERDMVVKII